MKAIFHILCIHFSYIADVIETSMLKVQILRIITYLQCGFLLVLH